MQHMKRSILKIDKITQPSCWWLWCIFNTMNPSIHYYFLMLWVI